MAEKEANGEKITIHVTVPLNEVNILIQELIKHGFGSLNNSQEKQINPKTTFEVTVTQKPKHAGGRPKKPPELEVLNNPLDK